MGEVQTMTSPVLVLAALAAICVVIAAVGVIAALAVDRHVTQQQMLWRAEYEHRLLMRGDPRGTYGRYGDPRLTTKLCWESPHQPSCPNYERRNTQ